MPCFRKCPPILPNNALFENTVRIVSRSDGRPGEREGRWLATTTCRSTRGRAANAVVVRLSFGSQFLRWSNLSLSLFQKRVIPGHRADSLLRGERRPSGVGGRVLFQEFREKDRPSPTKSTARNCCAAAARILAEPTARGHLGSRQRLAARRYSPLVPIRGGGGGSARSLRVHSAHAAAAGACQERPSPLRRGRRWARSSGQEGVDAPAAARIEMGGR